MIFHAAHDRSITCPKSDSRFAAFMHSSVSSSIQACMILHMRRTSVSNSKFFCVSGRLITRQPVLGMLSPADTLLGPDHSTGSQSGAHWPLGRVEPLDWPLCDSRPPHITTLHDAKRHLV